MVHECSAAAANNKNLNYYNNALITINPSDTNVFSGAAKSICKVLYKVKSQVVFQLRFMLSI